MQFTWRQIIDRARTYVDDDHDDGDGWLSEERWLDLANVEYQQLYRRWVRMGLIAPAWVDSAFTGPTMTIPQVVSGDGGEDDPYVYDAPGVLAIIGVAEDLGDGRLRPIRPAQSTYGRNPWWSTSPAAAASHWRATGTGDSITITIEPPHTGSYLVRFIPTVEAATSADDTVEVPFGCDERLALGLARRAKLKDASASALLERLVGEADAETNFLAFGRDNSDGPRIRRVRRDTSAPYSFPQHPSEYRYF